MGRTLPAQIDAIGDLHRRVPLLLRDILFISNLAYESGTMQNLPSYRSLQSGADSQAELERMQDVFLLLDNLAKREEATVKAILDCLYEVGSTRMINQRVNIKALRGPLKSIARFSKPVFRIFALRWFNKNCPRLITKWLFNQVKFNELPLPLDETDTKLIDVMPSPNVLPPLIEQQAAEINALRLRIGWLTIALIALILAIGVYLRF